MMDSERQLCEDTTGCRAQSKLGHFYADADTALTPEQAYDHLRAGYSVCVPNAGAGSFREFFGVVGFSEIKVIEWGSSAGDWTFGVRDGEGGDWHVAQQSNRYPYSGFSYSVDFRRPAESFEQLCELLGA